MDLFYQPEPEQQPTEQELLGELLCMGGVTSMIKDIGQPTSESYGEWFKPVEPYVMEEAKYFHQCPTCGGYLEKRGDFYTCQKCPFEWPPGGELEEKVAASQFMYHISPPHQRASILEHGLDASKSDPRGRLWSLEADWPAGQYLFTTYDNAEHLGDEDDIWQVNVDGLDLQPDPYQGEANDHAALVLDPIPPDRLQLVRQGNGHTDPWWEKTAAEAWDQMLQPGVPRARQRCSLSIHLLTSR